MTCQDNEIVLEVKDSGKGMSSELKRSADLKTGARLGVGFRGMQERLLQLGGSLTRPFNCVHYSAPLGHAFGRAATKPV
jgi:signal transduction histidine kinase